MKTYFLFLINLIYFYIAQKLHKKKFISSPPTNSPNIPDQNKKTNNNNNRNQNNIQNINHQISNTQKTQNININSINIQNNNEQENNQKENNLTLNDSFNNQKQNNPQQNNQQQNNESIIISTIFTLLFIAFDVFHGKKLIYIIDKYFIDYIIDYLAYLIKNLFIKFLIYLKNTILFIIKLLNQFHNEIKKYIPYFFYYLLMTFLGYILTDSFYFRKIIYFY